MSDIKFNSDKPEVDNMVFTDQSTSPEEKIDKSELLEFNLGKESDKAIDELKELDKKLNDELTADHADKEKKDFSIDKPSVKSIDKDEIEKKTEHKAEKTNAEQHKAMPDLNLKGIKVERVDNPEVTIKPQEKKAQKPDLAMEKSASKTKKPDLDMGEFIKKKEDEDDATQALPKGAVATVKKPAAKKPAPEKPDEKDSGKTMIMKDTSTIAKSQKAEKKAGKKPAESVSPQTKRKASKSQPGINYSIFGGFFLAFGIVIIAFIVAVGGISLGKEYLGIDKAENDITFNIPKGSTSSDIADLLEENHIIENKLLFRLALKLNAPDTIYPGDITLQPSMGYSNIIQQLGVMREKYETKTLSFPEGVTLLDVAKKLEKEGVCKASDFLFEFNKEQGYDFEKLITDNEEAFYHMEGYFFPDTYDFYVDDEGYNITKTVREHFSKKFNSKMLAKMKKRGLTLNELMTLASMVQWESGSVEDMPKVASVFLNRLDDPDTFPTMQSDATERYITKVIKVDEDTTQAELEHYTEVYDTYNYRGLPAGPICNPGLDAINAVLNPAKTNYYYFCNNLKTGQSFFAETLEEHEQNLKKAGLS